MIPRTESGGAVAYTSPMAARTIYLILATLCSPLVARQVSAQALSYQLGGGNETWPADRRAATVKAMDEAVAVYNRFGTFEKRLTANYNAGVPTAQGNYNGTIDFGTQFSTRVALHEISHTLGIGQVWPFDGGAWKEDSAAGRLIKLFDGRSAILNTGGTHFWPYGLNYDNEDGTAARERHVKLVSASRFDMGVVKDSDGDALPDDWEQSHFGSLAENASSDPDHDGVQNRDEYATDCDPVRAAPVSDGHTYVLRNQRGGRVLGVIGGSTNDAAGTELRDANGRAEQQWVAKYVGAGWFTFTNVNSSKLLQVASADTAAALPINQGSAANSATQQWRIAAGEGADVNYYQVANRETGRLLDGLDGAAGTAVKQYPYLGNILQQYWRFEEVGSGASLDAGSGSDAGATDASHSDASPWNDAASAGRADAQSDAASSASTDAQSDASGGGAPAESGADDVADDTPSSHDAGCSLIASPQSRDAWETASLALLALAFIHRRNSRPRRRSHG